MSLSNLPAVLGFWRPRDASTTSLPGEQTTAQMVHTLPREAMTLNQQGAELDKAIEARFREHRDCEVHQSVRPGGLRPGCRKCRSGCDNSGSK